jgi:3-oxoadipate enol-lactonase
MARRSGAVGAALLGAAVGAGLAASRKPRPAPGPDLPMRQPSWLGRRLDPIGAVGNLGVDVPPLLPGRTVEVPGRGEMFFRDSGERDGVPVVLLHGWMAGADLNWFLVYGKLAEHHRVIAPDHRGHGRGIRSGRPFSLEDCADDVAGLLRELGIERAVVVGYSMGGPIALLTWRRHRDLVAGLVLEATGLRFDSTPLQRFAWRTLGLMGVLLRWPTGRIVLLRIGGGGIEDVPEELFRYGAWADGEFRRNDPAEMVEAGRALAHFNATSFASSVDVPIAVVATTGDRLVPLDDQLALAEATDAKVFEVSADHSAVATQTEELATATLQAIAAVLPEAEAEA